MGEKRRLSDVIKLKGSAKWAFFERVNASQDGALLEPISMKNKSDAASVAQLIKLIDAEQKKTNYDHVITIVRTIRRCFLDDEAVFRAMVNGGLDKIILKVIAELRVNAARAGINGQAPQLRQLLANLSDMFEWDFFAKSTYNVFVGEMMAVLTSCNDCDDSLFTEAASVVMSMCTTDISKVIGCLLQCKTSTSMLKKALRDLPRAKSFFYQALLLELVYKLHRHSKKHGDDKMTSFAAKLNDAFPTHIARMLPQVPPKAFRNETRRILNDFNVNVGVIKSFQLKAVDLSGAQVPKFPLKPVGWIDLGGTILEIEAVMSTGAQEGVNAIKLPYTTIASVAPSKSKKQVVVAVRDSVQLSEIVDNGNDLAKGTSDKLQLCLSFDDEGWLEVANILSERRDSRLDDENITISSSIMKSELKVPAADKNRSFTDIERTLPNRSFQSLSSAKLHGNSTTDKKLLKRNRNSTDAKLDLSTSKASSGAVDKLPTGKINNTCRQGRSFGPSDDCEQRIDEGVRGYNEHTLPATTSSPSSKSDSRSCEVVVVPEEDQVQEDHHTMTEDQVAAQKQKFRQRQTHQLHQLQSLVEDIVEANDQFRQFTIASLCRELSGESDRLLNRKRKQRDRGVAFDATNAAVQQSEAKRTEDLSRRESIQRGMHEVISASTVAQTEASTRAEKILATIQETVDTDLRQNFDRVQKKLRSQATQCATHAKEKLVAIEKAFNTDDLQAMQQMLQRI